MGSIEHLSIRVPWRDRAWDDKLCDNPLASTSCALFPNIGEGRDDELEVKHSGAPVGEIFGNLPHLSERATFMPNAGYALADACGIDPWFARCDIVHRGPEEASTVSYLQAFGACDFGTEYGSLAEASLRCVGTDRGEERR